MGLDAGFLSMLTHRVTWRQRTGEDVVGNDRFSSGTTIPCFITSQTTADPSTDVADTTKESPAYQASFITDGVYSIKPGDKINIGTVETVVQDTNDYRDEDGTQLLMQEVSVSKEQ